MPATISRFPKSDAARQVGSIGLGNTGSLMAANLVAADFPLVVHDTRREAAGPLVENGASWAE